MKANCTRQTDFVRRHVLALCHFIVHCHILTQLRGGLACSWREQGNKGKKEDRRGNKALRQRVWMSHGAEAVEQWL